jgi:hypothetical protein
MMLDKTVIVASGTSGIGPAWRGGLIDATPVQAPRGSDTVFVAVLARAGDFKWDCSNHI